MARPAPWLLRILAAALDPDDDHDEPLPLAWLLLCWLPWAALGVLAVVLAALAALAR